MFCYIHGLFASLYNKENVLKNKISYRNLPLILEKIKHPKIINTNTINKPRIGNKIRNFIIGSFSFMILSIVVVVVVRTIPFKQL